MKAAIYARYSTDRQTDNSIAGQNRNCETFAEREGCEIVARFADRGISGTKSDRPDYQRMLMAAKAKRFDVLLVDDLSRLSRDDVETKMVIRRLRFGGIRIVGVSDGFDSDSKGYKVQAGVRGLMNELYIDDLREKTFRGLRERAINGRSAGGCPYGYAPVYEKNAKGQPKPAGREIVPEQAAVVLQIFAWAAEGRAPRWMANELNRRGLSSPRGGKWKAGAIYGHPTKGTGILNNELYVGRLVWNRSEWLRDPDTGKRVRREKARDEWIETEVPEARIVPDELWNAVKSRQRDQREASESIRKALHRNARTGARPKFLFSGLLVCGECGSRYTLAYRDRYGCSARINGGGHACGNGRRVARDVVEDRLLEAVRRDLFTDDALKKFKRHCARLLAERKRKAKGDDARKKLAAAEKRVANLTRALADGYSAALTAELKSAEAEAERLRAEFGADRLDKVSDVLPDAANRFQRLVADLDKTLQRDVHRARSVLKGLLGEKIRIVPEGEQGLVAELQGDYEGLLTLAGKGRGVSVVAGAGFEPATFGL